MAPVIRVVIADDSPTVCRLLGSYLTEADGFEVVARTHTGMQTLEAVRAFKPHVVTLDCDLPDMSGLDTLDLLMRHCPTPVVMLSALNSQSADIGLEALQLGAVDVIWKYSPGVDTDLGALRQEILAKVRIAARVKVIRALRMRRPGNEGRLAALAGGQAAPGAEALPPAERVVVIGASTGGPVALRAVLEALPAGFDAALVVVQHMPAAFTRALARQLNRCVALEVREAREGDSLQAGVVLVAPGDRHMVFDTGRKVRLKDGPKISGHRPNISLCMRSAVEVFGLRTSAVLLTGMGTDGVEGLQAVREQGGRVYVQDPATCVVDGMPRSAIERGLADHVAAPEELAALLMRGGGGDAAPGTV